MNTDGFLPRNPKRIVKPGSMGRPLPGIEAAIERRLALYPLQGSGYGL